MGWPPVRIPVQHASTLHSRPTSNPSLSDDQPHIKMLAADQQVRRRVTFQSSELHRVPALQRNPFSPPVTTVSSLHDL